MSGVLPQSQKIFSEYMINAGIKDTVKIVTIPMAQNKILMRIQNLEDKFNSDASTKQVNLTMVIEGMWKSAHSANTDVGCYTLTETSVTGNMPLTEMENRRLKWQTDDGIDALKKLSHEINGEMIQLEPMRIRTFTLEFN